jgi:thiamine monophosphate synthase
MQAILGGVTVVQVREKNLDTGEVRYWHANIHYNVYDLK